MMQLVASLWRLPKSLPHTICRCLWSTLLRQEAKAAPPSTQTQTQGGCPNEEMNMAQVKEQIKTPEKELNEMELSNLSVAEFKTLVKRMPKGLSETLNSIRKIQSEMKETLLK